MSVNSSRRRVDVALAAVLAAALVAAPSPASATPSTYDPALAWYDSTAATVATTVSTLPQVTNSRTWAISWLAAARVLHAAPANQDYQHAALAGAVHETLVSLTPASAPSVDATLATALTHVRPGAARDRGLAAGRAAARRLLAERAGDGLDPASVNAPFPLPAPAPGVWQPTPPAFAAAVQYGNRIARPFTLERPSQYRLAPPPALGSPRYRADLAEVRAYGAADSTVRTQAQLDTATFWYGSSLTLYTGILRAALAQQHTSLYQRTLLVALFHVALVDTQIATSDTKYAYQTWRPVTAIRAAAVDADPNWLPVHVTPAHPDYPSGHNTYSGSAEQVLTALVGPRAHAPYTIDSPTAPGVTRTYTDWRQPSLENVDARVWSGIHTRTADEAGIRLGNAVAAHTIRTAVRLLG
jgi:hypothetical protein